MKRVKKLGIVAVAIAFASAGLTGCQSGGSRSVEGCSYEVILPEGYEESKETYPVVYVLPEDGLTIEETGLAEELHATMQEDVGTPMIIVKTSFEAETDVSAALTALTESIDKDYRTIPEKECRVLAGTGAGGYLAYAVELNSEEEVFGSLVSIRGDFVSEDNPWYDTYGDVFDKMKSMQDFHMNFFDENYTYLDAPVEDGWTNMEGSTNDIGAWFIQMGTGSASHEFTVRSGEYDEEFLQESARRVADRITTFMAASGIEGTENFVEDEAKEELAPVLVTKDMAEVNGEYQMLDLSGSWYFEYKGPNMISDVAKLEAGKYQQWSVVEAGTSNWTKGYGNISDENVDASYGEDYFDYFIIGNAYYVKEFELPENFNSKQMVISVGYVDDRCEVFVNGQCVGRTGLDDKLQLPTGETTWAEYSCFEFDSSLLKYDGINTVVVRAYNDGPYGGGGWYEGPIYLASKEAYEGNAEVEEKDPYFYEETFTSSYAAKALGEAGTVDNKYLIYLPKDYYETEESYPTLYLLHQFNSDHTSYKTDDINVVLDEAMAAGTLDEMIVVIPNSSEESWWADEWEQMVTEELIPHIDANYRTIPDAGARLTAGCSMGGQGAFSMALNNPEYFSGAASFYGAFSMPPSGEYDVLEKAENESKEYLDQFALYFICGNQDVYGFGKPAIELNQILEAKDIEHEFFVENGGHDSAFYLPHFVEALAYLQGQMEGMR